MTTNLATALRDNLGSQTAPTNRSSPNDLSFKDKDPYKKSGCLGNNCLHGCLATPEVGTRQLYLKSDGCVPAGS